MKDSINLIFEAAVVKRLERTGWQILGDNRETVGEHSFMTAVISYLLAKDQPVNMEKILLMSIFHDFHEGRVGDVDKIATLYVKRDIQKANNDIFHADLKLLDILTEYEAKKSPESTIVYEANILALLVEVKQLVEKGNQNAAEWLTWNARRVKLAESKKIAEDIIHGNTQDWWKDIRNKLSAQASA